MYCITIWGNSSESFLHPINILYNKFIKALLFLPKSTTTILLYSSTSTLTLNKLYKFAIAVLIYKYFYFPTPLPSKIHQIFSLATSIHKYQTRGSSSNNLFCKSSLMTSRHNALAIQGQKIWISLPLTLKSASAITQFKNGLKHFY